MRVHISSIVTIFAALLLVSGTVGCRSNGGPWYNPATYSFSNPFGKERQESPYSSNMAKTKPSLDSQPNISTPHGGYTDSASRAGSPASTGGTVSSSPPEHLAQYNSQYNPATQQNSPNPYSSYTVADPSQYSPYTYTESYGGQSGGQPYNGQGSPASPYQYSANQGQQSPYQYRQEAVQHAQNYPAMPYGEQLTQTTYQTTSAYQPQPYQPQSANNVPAGPYGNTEQPGQYAPFGTTPQSDSYAGTPQPTAVSPSGFGQGQPVSTPYTYPGEGVSVASPYQPYQPPVANGGHNY